VTVGAAAEGRVVVLLKLGIGAERSEERLMGWSPEFTVVLTVFVMVERDLRSDDVDGVGGEARYDGAAGSGADEDEAEAAGVEGMDIAALCRSVVRDEVPCRSEVSIVGMLETLLLDPAAVPNDITPELEIDAFSYEGENVVTLVCGHRKQVCMSFLGIQVQIPTPCAGALGESSSLMSRGKRSVLPWRTEKGVARATMRKMKTVYSIMVAC
jgi:hypothetical protein